MSDEAKESTPEQSENRDPVDNLIPYEPGQSGNPAGRPKGAKDGIRAQMGRILKSKAPEKLIKALGDKGLAMGDGNFADVLAARAITKAATGDVAALRYVSEQTEKALPKPFEHTGQDGGPIEVADARGKLRELVEKRKAGDDEGGGGLPGC